MNLVNDAHSRRAGITSLGEAAAALIKMDDPPIDWIALGKSMNVPSVCVATAEDFSRELKTALAEPGPHLIEAVLGR